MKKIFLLFTFFIVTLCQSQSPSLPITTVNNLKISTPLLGTKNDSILVYRGTGDKVVRFLPVSSIAGGGSGVQSVTGPTVDNTDASNPIVNVSFITEANGAIHRSDIVDALGGVDSINLTKIGGSASGDLSHADSAGIAEGEASHANSGGSAYGNYSQASGKGSTSTSFSETAVGTFNEVVTPQSATAFNANDLAFSIGIGSDGANLLTSFSAYKNGGFKFVSRALSNITNQVKGFFAVDENARPNVHDGTQWNALAYLSEIDGKLSESDVNIFCDFNSVPSNLQYGFFENFVNSKNGSGFATTAINAPIVDASNMGVWYLKAGSGSNNYNIIGSADGNSTLNQLVLSSNISSYETFIYLDNLTDSSNFISGFINQGLNVTQTNGCYFLYNPTANSGRIQCITVNSGTATTTSLTGITVTNKWFKFKVIATSTSVLYYVDGSLVATHTTNIPTARIGYGFGINNNTTGPTTVGIYADFFRAKFKNLR